ncbi:MAG: glutamate-5-semialdehyde dehydrogenase, partial [Oscillospiraceae bacterium]|nr:glutamate-5-semialdehyde dehydrogenase [Candidatus Equicaccousia limihippi]
MTTLGILQASKVAAKELLGFSGEQRSAALLSMADALIQNTDGILKANRLDLEKAKGTVSDVMLDRLMLNQERIKGMAQGIKEVAQLNDPLEGVIETHTREDGLVISKVPSPFGVIAIIYESRPNVTSDAAALAVKSGNACILRCGKEAHQSALAITEALQSGLAAAGLPENAVLLIEDTTRESANTLMTANGYIDLLIPRGGKGLISACVQNATVPCIETGTGICHIYVDKSADFDMALKIIENAKISRPSVCNSAEVCLVDKAIAKEFIPLLQKHLSTCTHPVELRFDKYCAQFAQKPKSAAKQDFDTEFLDYIMAVGAVDGVNGAIEHIDLHSTHHSEAIITDDQAAADEFSGKVDSAAVYHNASTRFTDGGEFGLGCEMGISTQKLHARGPMGL